MEQVEVNPAPETEQREDTLVVQEDSAALEPQPDSPAGQLFILAGSESDAPDNSSLKAVIEAVIYVTEEPLTIPQIATALQSKTETVRAILDELLRDYSREDRGITIREVAGGFKMATKPEHHEALRAFVKSLKPPMKLSLPALETIAVIAYKQPITAPEIMEIRGVQGAGVLKTLLDRKLIATAGRKNVIGKPILYKTTKEFLLQFGLKDLSELPTLKEFEELTRLALNDADLPAPAAHGPQDPPDSPGSPDSPPIEEPAHPSDPGPAEDPQQHPVREDPDSGARESNG